MLEALLLVGQEEEIWGGKGVKWQKEFKNWLDPCNSCNTQYMKYWLTLNEEIVLA